MVPSTRAWAAAAPQQTMVQIGTLDDRSLMWQRKELEPIGRLIVAIYDDKGWQRAFSQVRPKPIDEGLPGIEGAHMGESLDMDKSCVEFREKPF